MQLHHLSAHGIELSTQWRHDDRLHEPFDRCAIGIVRAQLRPLARVEATLEQGAEDGRLDE